MGRNDDDPQRTADDTVSRRDFLRSGYLIAPLAAAWAGSTTDGDRVASPQPPSVQSCVASEASAERDDIYQLLAYAIVSARWQGGKSREGHNIAAILVSADGDPAYWATNANFVETSAIEHAEARVIRNYLAHRRRLGHPMYRLAGAMIYATLEPCAMCAGMMALTRIARVTYGQSDPVYGRASERLGLDSRAGGNGFAPYPNVPSSLPSSLTLCARLDAAYRASGIRRVTAWLDTPQARGLFAEARERFDEYQPRCPGNEGALQRARALFVMALH